MIVIFSVIIYVNSEHGREKSGLAAGSYGLPMLFDRGLLQRHFYWIFLDGETWSLLRNASWNFRRLCKYSSHHDFVMMQSVRHFLLSLGINFSAITRPTRNVLRFDLLFIEGTSSQLERTIEIDTKNNFL